MPLLKASEVTKEFATSDPPVKVLRGISLDVEPGEFLAIMGASGSGKSTLLYAISGMDAPTSGQVWLGDEELTALKPSQLSAVRLARMGFVFQQAYFLENLSIRDNIALPGLKAGHQDVDARVDALMERFDITHVATHAINQVSGGQLQRAALCRALITSPDILFADEPTGALNSAMTKEVLAALIDVRDLGTSIVMVTHDPRCASYADRIIYLRDGLIVDSLTPGPWTADSADSRHERTLEWLAGQSF
ncbi:Bacitracin export ATP-binding protein BceA [Corynebacterium kalinowskii]|uniref:Bacitracin export ATP-binding protein BceA n=1 Tax=Corynebacterium kalinowskii TaxID=2675216 RepID=A0A6B8VPM7_9CORY|nr:ABC transporter ATP-binding protein [Corynebacterium kalinowskii]QGU00985.1 Bacitracin export ATP-binding protein BceA [Corynebacterium kalinowskii]